MLSVSLNETLPSSPSLDVLHIQTGFILLNVRAIAILYYMENLFF